jgi:hypothetical protein
MNAAPSFDWRARQDLNPRPLWFVGDSDQFVVLVNQRLAALAKSLTSHIKAQFGHSKYVLGTRASSPRTDALSPI